MRRLGTPLFCAVRRGATAHVRCPWAVAFCFRPASVRGVASAAESPAVASDELKQSPVAPQRQPATVVTAATFNTDVLQSQSALCVIFHCNTHACRRHIQDLEELAFATNAACRYQWIKIVTIDADRHANLASAFSVERRRVPMTFFTCSGTIIDKVSGNGLPRERLNNMIIRFREYFEKTRGVELEDHGAFAGAKSETLTTGATTEALETQLETLLVGASAVSKGDLEELRDTVGPLISKALQQSRTEVDELRAAVGTDVKKLDESVLVKQLHSANAYIAAAHVAGLHALYLARLAAAATSVENESQACSDAERAIASVTAEYRGAAQRSTVRRAVARAELILAAIIARRLLVESNTEKTPEATQSVSRTAAKRVVAVAELLDSPVPPAALPVPTVEPLMSDIKMVLAAIRDRKKSSKSGDTASVVGLEDLQLVMNVVKRTVIAALALYHDDPAAIKLRARLTSLIY